MNTAELYNLAKAGNDHALWSLCLNYKPLFISESRKYASAMADLMTTEDWISEGNILVWDIISKDNYDETREWGAYLKKAVRWRFNKIYENHVMRGNWTIGAEAIHDDDGFTRFFGAGFGDRFYVESGKAEKYREQARLRQKRWYEKKIAEEDAERERLGLEPLWRPSLASEEEKKMHRAEARERQAERVKQYQSSHKEEIATR